MSQERQPRIQERLTDIDCFVDWEALVDEIQVIDKTGSKRGGRPRYPLIKMLKMVFLQHLYNPSNPELEDQLLDRRSFRKFVGITSDEEVPDFSTIWIFKDKLIEHELLNGLFERVVIDLFGNKPEFGVIFMSGAQIQRFGRSKTFETLVLQHFSRVSTPFNNNMRW